MVGSENSFVVCAAALDLGTSRKPLWSYRQARTGPDINGARYVVKLYFKADQLNKARVDIITQVMHDEFGQQNAGFRRFERGEVEAAWRRYFAVLS
jgi:hypothetical protein